MKEIIIAAVALISLMSLVPVAMPTSTGVTGTVNVPIVCAIDVSSTSLDFGQLGPTETSADKTTTVSQPQNGNSPDIGAKISGSGWIGAIPPHVMDVGQTHWSTSTITDFGGTPLTGSGVSIGPIGPSGSQVVHLMLRIPGEQLADTYTQTITFTACA